MDPQPVCNRCGHDLNSGWIWAGYTIIWFVIFFFLWWALYASLKLPFVMDPSTNTVDTVAVAIWAAVSAPLTLLFIYGIRWLIKYAF
jgi:hypothetical protein